MYGLPENLSLEFLVGLELQQVCFSRHQLILIFGDQVNISVESAITIRNRGVEPPPRRGLLGVADQLLSLLNETVLSANGRVDGTLTLGFSNDRSVEVFDSNAHYESYQIHNGDELIVV